MTVEITPGHMLAHPRNGCAFRFLPAKLVLVHLYKNISPGAFSGEHVRMIERLVMYCPNFSLLVWKQTAPRVVLMTRLRCKSWTCPYCNKKNREMWSSFLKKKIPRVATHWWFVTLTAHEHLRSAARSLANIRGNIDRLMKRARRVWSNLQYVRVFEVHLDGAFHAHLIMAGLSARVSRRFGKNKHMFYRPCEPTDSKGTWGVQTWWKKNARSIGMGYKVEVTPLDNHVQAVRYVCKYLTKDGQAFTEKGLRRVQTTTCIGSPKTPGDGGWKVDGHVWIQDIPAGGHLVDLNTRSTVPDEYWLTHTVYPSDDA